MITRSPFLTILPVNGVFKYRDTLQLIPSSEDDPCPPFKMGWYGGTLAVSFDENTSDTRVSDCWAYDHRERDRFDYLKKRTNKEEWLAAVDQDLAKNRRLGIEKEALNLLQVVSNNIFRTQESGHNWFLDPETMKVNYGQLGYPSFNTDNLGSFLGVKENKIPLVDPVTHFSRAGIGPDDVEVTLPSNIVSLLDSYFNLPKDRKVKFEQACNLFRSAQETWVNSKSLALAAHVFAIDTLCHVDDPSPEKCKECNNLKSNTTCDVCGGPKFGITRRFRNFVSQFLETPEDKKLSKRLFEVRSSIAHQGKLLRLDQYDTGFNTGGNDAQHELSYSVSKLSRKVIVGWLENTGNESN